MNSKFNRIITVSILIFVALILLFIKPVLSSMIDKSFISIVIGLLILSIILHFLIQDNSNWLRIDSIFILGFIVVHIQWPIMYAFSDLIPESYYRIFVDDRLFNYSTWLSTLGAIFFLIGYNIYQPLIRKIKIKSYCNYQNLLLFTVSSFLIFLVFAGKFFLTGGIYKEGGIEAKGEGISKYFSLFFHIGLIVLTVIIIYENKNNYKGKLIQWFFGLNRIYLITVIVYVLLFMMIGVRGYPMFLILTILILIGTWVRRFRFFEVLVLTIVGGFILTIIGLNRNDSIKDNVVEFGLKEITEASMYNTTLELANSIRTLHTAVEYVPKYHDYFYGSLWSGSLLSPIPFAQSFYLSQTDSKWYELGSSGYITYLVLGENPISGEGTSLIADIYMNFGLIGVIFFMLLLGLFLKKLTWELKYPSDYKWLIVAATIAGTSLFYARGGYLMTFRDVIWGILFFTFLVKSKYLKH